MIVCEDDLPIVWRGQVCATVGTYTVVDTYANTGCDSVTHILNLQTYVLTAPAYVNTPVELLEKYKEIIDKYWTEHINTMSHLREGIHLRSYAQNNPLREYKNEVAVVLLDMVMPVMDGREFLTHKNADEDTVDIPVIVISSENDEGLQVDMLQMGVNDYITKPFVAEVIARRVKNVIDYNERFRKMVKEYQNMSKD